MTALFDLINPINKLVNPDNQSINQSNNQSINQSSINESKSGKITYFEVFLFF